MSIPAAPAEPFAIASTVLTLFEQLHDQVRWEIEGLDDDGLNWVPDAGANAVATIVTHIVGSEAETLRCVAGVTGVRDRASEFVGSRRYRADILGELRTADALIENVRSEIDAHRLQTVLALPTLPPEERRTGLTWLVGNYGHAREHVGHIQLTKQLYLSGSPEPSTGGAHGGRGTRQKG